MSGRHGYVTGCAHTGMQRCGEATGNGNGVAVCKRVPGMVVLGVVVYVLIQ